MARPRSEDKRQAILQAATQLFAEEGLNAPTVRIAKAAGVAEGTIFTYFANKDQLMNQLYLELKGALRKTATLPPPSTDLRESVWQAWQAYIAWTLAHPKEHEVLAKLAMSARLTEETRTQAQQAFGDVTDLLGKAMAQGGLRNQTPIFVGALMGAMADTTRDFITQDPASAETISKDGFSAFWNAITTG